MSGQFGSQAQERLPSRLVSSLMHLCARCSNVLPKQQAQPSATGAAFILTVESHTANEQQNRASSPDLDGSEVLTMASFTSQGETGL